MRVEDKYIQNFEKINSMKKKSTDTSNVQDGGKEKNTIAARSEVSSLLDRVKNAPDIRKEKVDQIRSQLEAGTYNVSGKKVAEKIVGAALDNIF
ncbi:MAG: flagellar biosynthesis anti-sigma factor FlgM [Calditerrivibrio sp.]|nr:flagellar biosynthesis anti-sigma factor FlgM [Calditerrivibrio sp.]